LNDGSAGGRRSKWLVFLAIGTGMFAMVADVGATIVALPTIAGAFGTDLPVTQWVVLAYALTITVLLVPMGRVSDILGRKRVYLAGFVLFAAGAAAAGCAGGMTTLVLARVLMGMGSAMTQGPAMAIMISVFPQEQRGRALGLQMSAVGSGVVAGPVLGGFIVSAFGWRGVFFTVALLGAVTLVTAAAILEPGRDDRRPAGAFDWAGAALLGGLLLLFLLAVTGGPELGWTSPAVLAAFAGMALMLAGFIRRELRAGEPLLEMRYFRNMDFTLGVASRFIMFLGMSSVRYLLPFYVQSVLGHSARLFGLIALPASLCTIVVSPLSGWLSDRWGWKTFTIAGLAVSAAGLLLLAAMGETALFPLLIGAWALQRIGHGSFSAPNNSSVLAVVDRDGYGVTAGFLNMVRNAGNVTGTALATAVVTGIMVSRGVPPVLESTRRAAPADVAEAFVAGMRIAYIVPACLICAVVLLYAAFRLRAGRSGRKPRRSRAA